MRAGRGRLVDNPNPNPKHGRLVDQANPNLTLGRLVDALGGEDERDHVDEGESATTIRTWLGVALGIGIG